MIQMFGFRVTEWCLGHSSGKVKKNKFITKKKPCNSAGTSKLRRLSGGSSRQYWFRRCIEMDFKALPYRWQLKLWKKGLHHQWGEKMLLRFFRVPWASRGLWVNKANCKGQSKKRSINRSMHFTVYNELP